MVIYKRNVNFIYIVYFTKRTKRYAIPNKFDHIENETEITTSRSGGPGGQHANKVETRVTVRFDIQNSQLLSEEEKIKLKKKLKSSLSNTGELILSSDKYRSQHRNKEEVIQRLKDTLTKGLRKKKKRIPTKPGKGAVEKRIKAKKIQAEKKKFRGKI